MSIRSPRTNPKKFPFELTPREIQVLELAEKGKSNKEIAAEIGVKEVGNIKKSLQSAREKLACQEI